MIQIKRMGWRRDLPDFRDYSISDPKLPQGFVAKMLEPLQEIGADSIEVDMRPNISRLVDQDVIGSCTGHGGIGLYEFLEKKLTGRFTPLSRLFLYKATRNFIGLSGDTGAEIRNMMGALALFGAPPEEFYPYEIAKYDEEPAAFLYALAANYKGIKYARLDHERMRGDDILEACKGMLLRGWPFVFGFTCYQSLDDTGADGSIPFPKVYEQVTGGHCMYATGFSDTYDKCKNATTPGAFSGPNSWGRSWGENGCYWMPYDYLRRHLMTDCWILTKASWVDLEAFK